MGVKGGGARGDISPRFPSFSSFDDGRAKYFLFVILKVTATWLAATRGHL